MTATRVTGHRQYRQWGSVSVIANPGDGQAHVNGGREVPRAADRFVWITQWLINRHILYCDFDFPYIVSSLGSSATIQDGEKEIQIDKGDYG